MSTARGASVIPVRLSDEAELLVEVTNLESEMLVASRPADLTGVLELIQNLSGELVSVLAAIKPQRATVEFGLEVALKSGQLTALWVQASGKANLKITLQWESPQAGR